MTQAKQAPASGPSVTPAASGRRIQVRKSGVHGKGVYAVQALAKGDTLIEYTGEIISWKEALRRHPHDPDQPDHTFYFSLGDGKKVIDANVGGNASRWINHACKPNCEADEDEEAGRVFIKALRAIEPGEELFYDYGLSLDEPYTPELKARFACHCGAKRCRGTMLAPKEGEKKAKKAKGASKGKAGKAAKADKATPAGKGAKADKAEGKKSKNKKR